MAKKPTPAKKPRPSTGRTKKSTPAKSAPAKAEPEAVPVIATIKDVAALNELPALAKKLASEGMTVNQVMPNSGVISGSCPPDQIPALNKKVPGVVVEPELTAHPS